MRKHTYIGLFMVTMATLMLEILLTRIFSVTMWYHFAFMAVSIALFGMTVGAIIVYLFPTRYSEERALHQLGLSSLLFCISTVVCFLIYRVIPPATGDYSQVVSLLLLIATYVVIAVPFVFSGIAVCLALTRFPAHISKLYAADLAGAAIGCILLVYVLGITDGPTAVFVIAALAGLAAILFALAANARRLVGIAAACSLLLVGFVAMNTIEVHRQAPMLRLIWEKNNRAREPIYEKWNSFSRITVYGDPDSLTSPFGWGISDVYPIRPACHQLALMIDSSAGTVLTGFDGDLNSLEHLKYDVINMAHFVRPNSDVLVVGTGGGRDILSALTFKQKSVVGVEINQDILKTVDSRFGDFTGHLDKRPGVRFVADEARSYIARQNNKFDIIQVSLIDTWAATAAGAFVLSENSLYTVEAWETLAGHLRPRGVLTFSRWYFAERPGETYRLVSLATKTLSQMGTKSPRDHIVVVAKTYRSVPGESPDGVATMLLCREPFTKADLDAIERTAREMLFTVVLSPRFSADDTFAKLTSGKDLDAFTAAYPLDISAPTDNRPFFFHMLRFRDALDYRQWSQGGMSFNIKAVAVLGRLLITVLVLTLLCIILPLALTSRKVSMKGALPQFFYFAAIGLGFMFVEISQMQRLIVFLGHPTYGLTVILFTLLLSSGLGSFTTDRIGKAGLLNSAVIRLVGLIFALLVFGTATRFGVTALQASVTPVRIVASIGVLFPLGFLMGMAFPIGMKAASVRFSALTPWFWGINGATSVCASVLAVVIAMNWGISASFWTGFGWYLVALIAFLIAVRRGQS